MAKAAETENPRYKCENVLQLELGNCHILPSIQSQSLDHFWMRIPLIEENYF